MSWPARLAFYERQAAAGNLQLLCRPCHVEKTLADIAKHHHRTPPPLDARTSLEREISAANTHRDTTQPDDWTI
jgi:5-methylcytosine-specific restriction endonuclease McrA